MTDDKSSALIEGLNREHRDKSQVAKKYGDMARDAKRKLLTCPTFEDELKIRLDIATAEYRIAAAMVELNAINARMAEVYTEVAKAEKQAK